MAENIISVSQFSKYVKSIFDSEEMLHNIMLVGEISSYNVSNNVAYFTIKDDEAMLPCVLFGASSVTPPQLGDMVIVKGSPNYYVKGGKFSFNVTAIAPYGRGYLYEKFLQMKSKLEKEGLFDASHKKPIPTRCRRVGVVTSSQGAVIQDIINVTTRRNDTIDIVLYPVKVQGIGAEQEIVKGINFFSNYDKVDCVIVARGGGSLEDLQPFNTEEVGRAVYNCKKPIISAVGHETDFTICDFCSDLRVPTPSAAAETIAWEKKIFVDSVISIIDYAGMKLGETLDNVNKNLILMHNRMNRTISYACDKYSLSTKNAIDTSYLRLQNTFEIARNKVSEALSRFEIYNPKKFLELGYSKVYNKNGQVVSSKNDVAINDEISIDFVDGKIRAQVKEK